HAITHDGPIVADVQLAWEKVALPPHYIQRMERIENRGVLALSLDPYLPLLLPVTLEGLRIRHLDHRGVKGSIAPQSAVIGELYFPHGFNDQEEIVLLLRDYPVGHAPGQHEIVRRLIGNGTELGLTGTPAFVDEIDLVAVGVADTVRHGGAAPAKDSRHNELTNFAFVLEQWCSSNHRGSQRE